VNSIAAILFVITMPVTTLTSFAEEYRCGPVNNPKAVECYSREVKDFLQSWVISWGNGDSDAYIEHYVPFRSPRTNISRDDWEADRRERIEHTEGIVVTLELDSLGIGKNGDLDVIFVQNYQSKNYSDVVKKQLFLKRDKNGLKIQREVTID
jgi:outer membrane protein, adhesin transport system